MKNLILSISELPELFFLIFFLSMFFFKKKKIFLLLLFFNTISLTLLSLPITSKLLKYPLYPEKNIYIKNLDRKFSLMLVPTSGFAKNKKNEYISYPSNSSINRLNNAYKFSKKLNIPIYISGGKTVENLKSEAEILKENFFKELSNKKIIIDSKSLNTNETGILIKKYLNENNLEKNIILFTDIYHFKRMQSVLEKNNINAFFLKKSFKKEEINFYDFIPNYKNYAEINVIKYSYFALINYIFLDKIDFHSLANN